MSGAKMKEPLLQKSESFSVYEPPIVLGFDGNLVALSTMNFFLNAAVSVITPFYPPTALSKGVSQSMIGFIFALNPIGSFSVSLTIGQMMGKLGKKNLMLYGLIFQSITIVTFGLIYYVDNTTLFIAISMITRFMQGASRSAYGASTFGYVPQLWPTSVQKKIGIMETTTAIGLVLGPMIGSALHNLAGEDNQALGYQLPFYVLSSVFILCIFSIRWLPPDVKSSVELDKVKAISCLKNQGILWTFMLMVASAIANCYINPQYTEHMKDLGLGEDLSGYVVSLGAFFYMVFLHLMPSISRKLDKKFIIVIGTFISIFAVLVQAPERYFGFPIGGDTWYYVTIGQCINGVGSAMVILPMIPELIELIVKNEMANRKIAVPDTKLIRACSDMGSSIFVGGYALGTFIGPFAGGLLYENLPGNSLENFMNESRIFSVVILFIMIAYLTIGKGYYGFSATLKKMDWFQPKRVLTQQSPDGTSSPTKQRGDQNINKISDGTEDSSTTPSIIVQNRNNNIRNTPEQNRNAVQHNETFTQSEVSDELLSDDSSNEVLSHGSEDDDIEINPRLPSNMVRKQQNVKEKDIFFYE